MSSCWQLDGFSPLWIFDGRDWCEAAWLHPSVADAFESFLCQLTDSLVTWVARHWLIRHLIAWLQPRGVRSARPRVNSSSIYIEAVEIVLFSPLLLTAATVAPDRRRCLVVLGLSCVVAPADRILLVYPLKPARGAKIQSRNSRHGWNRGSDSACPTESALGWARGFRDVTNIINRALAYSLSISQSWAPLAAPRQTPSNTHGCYWSSRDWCFRGPRRWPRLWKIYQCCWFVQVSGSFYLLFFFFFFHLHLSLVPPQVWSVCMFWWREEF